MEKMRDVCLVDLKYKRCVVITPLFYNVPTSKIKHGND